MCYLENCSDWMQHFLQIADYDWVVSNSQKNWTHTNLLTTSPDSDPDGELDNGETVTGLTLDYGEWQFFKINVPSGTDNLEVKISGRTGDADIYVRFDSNPTLIDYDCRPYLNGSDEECLIPSLKAGYYHIGVYAYKGFVDVSLYVEYK